ncbi:kinase-like domain-containing protein [Rhizophagus irregularis DAOM 181602=DAOM 197198]|nr:kinase-like domain-containing protein [Rhizophagus irregularis DAOM 181602=DAOM 197198]
MNISINELVNSYFKEVNEGKEGYVIREHIIEYIENLGIDLQEMFKWLLNNQNDTNSIYLLGYFNYQGIGINTNILKAIELYQKAAYLDNNAAQFDLANIYVNGDDQDYEEAFKLSKKLAEKEYSCGINLLGFCYDGGIGTDVNLETAFGLYKKATDLGNGLAQYNLALMYEKGSGTEKNIDQAIYWYKKSAEQGDVDAQNKLKKLLNE